MSNASNADHDPGVGRDHFGHRSKRQAHRCQRHLFAFQSLNKLFHGGRIGIDVLVIKKEQNLKLLKRNMLILTRFYSPRRQR